MSYKKRREELKETEKKVAKWAARVEKTGNSAAKFCRNYDIPEALFSRWIQETHVPSPKNVAKVEAALASEGV